jgi:hypothetical protein
MSAFAKRSPKHVQLLRFDPIAALALQGFKHDQRRNRLIFIGEPVHADLTALPYAAPLPQKRPFAKQIGQNRHPVKPGNVLRGQVLFEIGVHGSEMILARVFQGFGPFGADVVFSALNTGMAEQQLGRAQVAGC